MKTRSLREALDKPVVERVGGRKRSADGALLSGATSAADLLAPDGVDRSLNGVVQAGDSFMVNLEVRTFPPSLALGWLHDARLDLDAPGITVHQSIEPVADTTARRMLSRSENAALGTLMGDAQTGSGADVDAEQGREAAAALRRELAAGTDRLMSVAISVTVCGATAEQARQQAEYVRQTAAGQGVDLRVMRFLQWEGYLGTLPLALNSRAVRHDFSGRAAAMGLPLAGGSLSGRRGRPLFWGEHPRTGTPILWDRRVATNPHALVVAESGSGKTYAMSGYIAQEIAIGQDAVLILDPKQREYMQLVQQLGGVYLSLSANSAFHINPLELPRLTRERGELVARMQEDLLGQRVNIVNALIVNELRANGSAVDGWGVALVDRAIRIAYERRGIARDDSATFTRPMPTFSDVQLAVHELAEAESDAAARSSARDLARSLALFCRGTELGALFDHPSSIPTTNPLLGIDIWSLLSSSQNAMLKRVIPVVVADFFQTVAINRPTGRHYHLVLDEAHALLSTEAGARTMDMVFRVGRSLGFMATVITQGLADLQSSSYTETLLENAKTKLILGLNRDSNAVDRAAQLLHLNEQEQLYLASCQLIPGSGASALLLADGQRTKLWIPRWPETLHAIVTGQSL